MSTQPTESSTPSARRSPGDGRRPGAARRGGARPSPEPNPALAHLTLPMLRDYRGQLTDEEGRVSYWRRLVQARLDVVQSLVAGAPVSDTLPNLLATVPAAPGRSALLSVVTGDDTEIPALPDLRALWGQEPRPGDTVGNAVLLTALEEAERRLSAYRSAVLQRLEAATAELIARYHASPADCLVALPLR